MTAVVLFLLTTAFSNAQSLDYAKQLIDAGRYLEGAKQLRPLADGGNAEAQFLASTLFFEGKGVNKSETQGIKYATMSANQGYEDAIEFLVEYYHRKDQPSNAFNILSKATTRYPSLKKEKVGIMLAFYYINGTGTAKNEAEGIRILEEGGLHPQLRYSESLYYDYWKAKAHLAGCSDTKAYVDYLCRQYQTNSAMELSHLIMKREYADNNTRLKDEAEYGNSWAQAHLALKLMDSGQLKAARLYADRSMASGSSFGRAIYNKLNTMPHTYRVTNCVSKVNNVKFVKVACYSDKTEVYCHYYNNTGRQQRLTINPRTRIVHNGANYALKKSSVPSTGTDIWTGKDYDFVLTFDPLPADWTSSSFNLFENGSWMFYDIKGEEM
jgi:TPR repeat protein